MRRDTGPSASVFPGRKGMLVLLILLLALYWRTFRELYTGWTLVDSYYLHGFLVPPISLYFAWKQKDALKAAPLQPTRWGCALVVMACLLQLASDFLGLRVIAQFSLIPMLAGMIAAFGGWKHLGILWFPVLFLLFMIPIPPSITQSFALHIKLVASSAAVALARLFFLPVVQDGSYICFPNDKLIVGEVCGGLRSLIALISFGALAAYISRTRNWARLALFLAAGPVAVAANTLRIFFLCVVAYFYGSGMATGWVHDVSGVMIFVIAFILFFLFEALLRRMAPPAAPREGA